MNISAFNKCANCGACISKCPKDAIFEDTTGLFYRPVVDEMKCIDCGACVDVCPVNNALPMVQPICAYGGWNKDLNAVVTSSSGGVFDELANKIISEDGIVYSAVYSDDWKSVVFASSEEVEIERFKKSKYVESRVGGIFRAIKHDLASGRKVLFCGTPCQVAGLKQYLGADHCLLVTCDFRCGGLPSHKLYQDHLEYLEKKYRSEIISVDFRPKTYGWKRYAVRIRFRNGKVYDRLASEDSFLGSFLQRRTVRDNCLMCSFTNHHLADITIADFWNYKQFVQKENSEGMSLVICNTEKGRKVIKSISHCFYFQELPVHELMANLSNPKNGQDVLEKQRVFLERCSEEGLEKVFAESFPLSAKTKLRNIVVKILKRER